MILYLMIFFLLSLITISSDKNTIKSKSNKIQTFVIGLLFMTLSGFRAEFVGNDTIKYLSLFNTIQHNNTASFLSRYEIGFICFVKLLGKFSANPQILLISSSVIIWGSIIYFVKRNSCNPGLSYFILMAFGFMAFFMSGIRESIAIAICLLTFEYIKDKHLLKFIFAVFIASLFHTSAIIFLAAYPIFHIHFTKRNRLLLIVMGFGALLCLTTIMNQVIKIFPKYATYISSEYNNGIIRVASVINLFIIFCVFYIGIHYRKYINDDINHDGYLNLTFIGAIILLISLKFNLLDRLANYFTIFISIVIPNTICNKRLKNHRNFECITMTLFLLYFIFVQIMRPQWNCIYPYSFYWTK